MRDIRLLTLYKQHYLDHYRNTLNARISALGYYDGIDIQKVQDVYPDETNPEKSLAPIPELWYYTGKKIEYMEGGKSNQNIGLFRCVDDKRGENDTDLYWKNEKKYPFLAIGFMKIREPKCYQEVGMKLERAINTGEAAEKRICNSLTYITFDNADLVILMKSNSMGKLIDTLQGIEENPAITYVHYILGVEEAYLTACRNQAQILEEWNGVPCFVHEHICKVELNLATSGNPQLMQELKWIWDSSNATYSIRGYENISYSYVAGHCNLHITLPDTDIRALLIMLLPQGVITHQNAAYEHGLYNIETSFQMKTSPWKELIPASPKDPDKVKPGWCQAQIMQCKKNFQKQMIQNDVGLYSYYQSLIQTLNTLDQFERFCMSQEIFYLLFPSFSLFCRNLNTILSNSSEQRYKNRAEILKNALCKYLESANSVIYHTIHTDQVYLMIPGYCGTSFSIPIKLNLFYLWFIRSVITLLNDNQRKFECILTPVMESRPITEIIEMEPDGKDNLISVRCSQRTLFFPGDLFIICGHEMGHYVGKNLRCREKRIVCIMKTLAYYIVEGLFPEDYEDPIADEPKKQIFDKMKKGLRDDLGEIIKNIFRNGKLKEFEDKEYHAEKIINPLKRICTEILSEKGCGKKIYDRIREVPQEIYGLLANSPEHYVDYMRYITNIQNMVDDNRRILASSGVMSIIVELLIRTYREVFSDMAANAILECNYLAFHEAFCVSEGMTEKFAEQTIQQKIRERVAKIIVFERDKPESESATEKFAKQTTQKEIQEKVKKMMAREQGKSESEPVKGDKEAPLKTVSSGKFSEKRFLGNFSNYLWLNCQLAEYASECFEQLNTHLHNGQNIALLEQVRNVYRMFTSKDYGCNEIYNEMNRCITSYMEQVQREHEQGMLNFAESL